MTPNGLSPELEHLVQAAQQETAAGLPPLALERVRLQTRRKLAEPAPTPRLRWFVWGSALGLGLSGAAAGVLLWLQPGRTPTPNQVVATAPTSNPAPTSAAGALTPPVAIRAGTLTIRNEPRHVRATVFLDGTVVGMTPLTLQTPPGRHLLRLEAAGYVAREQELEVMADLELPITVVLGKHPAAAPPAPREPSKSALLAAALKQAEAALARQDCDAVRKAVALVVASSDTSDGRADALLLEAECQLRAGNRTQAQELFASLCTREPNSQAAETALFQAANLAVAQGDTDTGLALLTRYTSRYPKGLYHFAAQEHRCEVLLRHNNLAEARRCLEELQARYPTQSRAQDALLLLARLAHREGREAECVELLLAFLQEHPTSGRDADARLELLRCARASHHPDTAQFANDYLKRYPHGAGAKEAKDLQKP